MGAGRTLADIAVLSAAMSSGALSQATVRLSESATVANHEFTRIAGVRELSGGRVLVSDGGDRSLWIVDWNANRTRRLGREGRGPGEYASAGPLFPVGRDSTLFIDVAGSRHLLLVEDSIVETIGQGTPALRAGARNPLGADGSGHLIFSRPIAAAAADPTTVPRLDSVFLLRVSRSTGRVDTLARLMARPSRINMRGTGDRPTSIDVVINPLATGDQTAMYEDGAIAVARVKPFRVEWILGDGRQQAGPELPFGAPPVSETDKRNALRRLALQNGQEPADPSSRDDWPERMPPFLVGALVAAQSGELWIRRAPVAGRAETVYDIVNRRGTVTGRLTLPEAQQVVGAGRTAVYTVRTDDDGIQRLARQPLRR